LIERQQQRGGLGPRGVVEPRQKKIEDYKTKAFYVSLSAACDFRLLVRPKMRHEKEGELPPNENTDSHVTSFPLQWFFRSSTLFFAENLLLVGKYQPMDT